MLLIIEDDRYIRDMLQEALDYEGYSVTCVAGAIDALRLLPAMSPPPSLILLDWRMPGMSGGEFLAARRKDPALAAIPVVVMSGDSHLNKCSEEYEVAGCLRKPVMLADLLSTVARYDTP